MGERSFARCMDMSKTPRRHTILPQLVCSVFYSGMFLSSLAAGQQALFAIRNQINGKVGKKANCQTDAVPEACMLDALCTPLGDHAKETTGKKQKKLAIRYRSNYFPPVSRGHSPGRTQGQPCSTTCHLSRR